MQFVYHPNRSTEDASNTAIHLALTLKDICVRMLFIDFSSAINTIIPQQLVRKLGELGLNTTFCNWIPDVLVGRPQAVRIGNRTSNTTILNTGGPQGCVLSRVNSAEVLLTHDSVATDSSNHIIKLLMC